jgi:tetratricopeptide (TPR) repeat protein
LHCNRGFSTLRPAEFSHWRQAVHRRLGAFILLAGLALGGPAVAQSGAAPPPPALSAADENALITKAQAALDAKKWPEAEATLKQLIAAAPRWNYFEVLGNAQMGEAHFADSIASYQRAIALTPKDAGPATIGRIYTSIGNANLKLRKNDDAIAAYSKAAAIDPHPAVAYFNLCATFYNMGQTGPKAIATCDKAIAADPKKADAYFIKGSALFGNATIGKDKKPILPAGTLEALRQYLVLAPNGAHANDVKQMLDFVK